MILAPFSTYFMDVCVGFCPDGAFNPSTQTCNTTDQTALNNFNNCVNLLKPKQCQGSAMPIAVSGSTYYYGFEAGNKDCEVCCVCGLDTCEPQNCF